jgi:hypothetical protein
MMRELLQRRFGERRKTSGGGPPTDRPIFCSSTALPASFRPLGICWRILGCSTSRLLQSRRGRIAMPVANGCARMIPGHFSCRHRIRRCISCNVCARRHIVSRSRLTGLAGRKAIRQSELDEIKGIEPSSKRPLLNHFGSARGVKMAGLTNQEATPEINREIGGRGDAHFLLVRGSIPAP